jgi:HSP20 family molecular chaperone IbpA
MTEDTMANTTQEVTPKAKQEAEARERPRAGRYYVPDVDISEDADALHLWADMPGVTSDQVHVHLVDDTLHLEGRVSLDEYSGLTPVYTEYNVGDWVRRFTLPDANRYDRDAITARLTNGVLEVRLPKAERAKPRKIAVTAS